MGRGLLGDRTDVGVWFEKRSGYFIAHAEIASSSDGRIISGIGEARNMRLAKSRAIEDLKQQRRILRQERAARALH